MQMRFRLYHPEEVSETAYFQPWKKEKLNGEINDLGMKDNISYINTETLELFQLHVCYGLPSFDYYNFINPQYVDEDLKELISRLQADCSSICWADSTIKQINMYSIRTFPYQDMINQNNFYKYRPFLNTLATHALFPPDMKLDIESELYDLIIAQMLYMNRMTINLKSNPFSLSHEIIEFLKPENSRKYSIERHVIQAWIATLIVSNRKCDAMIWSSFYPEIPPTLTKNSNGFFNHEKRKELTQSQSSPKMQFP